MLRFLMILGLLVSASAPPAEEGFLDDSLADNTDDLALALKEKYGLAPKNYVVPVVDVFER